MTRVLVVGAGVIGCAIAHELAPDHEVCVLDREGVASGATGRSAGLIAPTLFFGDLPEAVRYTNDFFERFDGSGEFSFTRRDRLDLLGTGPDAHGESDRAASGDDGVDSGNKERSARERAAQLEKEGFPVRYLNRAAVEFRYPAFDADSFTGAVWYGDTGWVDPYTYAVELQKTATQRGARFETGVEVETVSERDGSVEVVTSNGARRADHVVLAAGWRTPDLVGGSGESRESSDNSIPVSPYRTQCVVLDPATSLPEEFPLVRASGEKLYFRPEHDGTLLVGGGYDVVEPDSASEGADEEFKSHVARAIPRLVQGFDDAGFVTGWAGVDSGTPDGRPVIDAISGKIIVATGFSGLGVMASPIAASVVRGLLTGEEPFPLAPFRLDRFEESERGVRFTSDA